MNIFFVFKRAILFIACLTVSALYSVPIDSTTAKNIACNFLLSNTNTQNRNVVANSLFCSYSPTFMVNNSQLPLYYVFNVPDGGFVIVAADDRAMPVLGYSLSSTFNSDFMPPNLSSYLNQFANQISSIIEQQLPTTSEIRNLWSQLASSSQRGNSLTRGVSPLLTTTWNQSPLYNNLCPEDTASYSGHAVSGCVSIAMAQIIKYWGWPSHGIGSHGYSANFENDGYGNYGWLYADFENTTYDYSLMPDYLNYQSTNAQINAVATLIYHCGVSVNMMYGYNLSGAFSIGSAPSAENALNTYFDYSHAQGISKLYYTDAYWMNVIRNQLDAGLPVYYAASSDDGGHAFVCDGYDNNNYFHFNWGWGGYADGYFLISNLNPSGYLFNESHRAIIDIFPPEVCSVSHSQLLFSTSLNTVSTPRTVSISLQNNFSPIIAHTVSPFQISSDSILWDTIASLPSSGGNLWVRFAPTSTQDYNALLTLSNSIHTLDTITLNGITCNPITSYPYYEFFESSQFPPNCWSLFNEETVDNSWERITSYPYFAHSGSNYLSSSSVNNSSQMVHNYLTTPFISVPQEGAFLHYWTSTSNTTTIPQYYEVRLSTSSLNPSDFSYILYQDSVDALSWEEHEISLQQFAGQSLYVSFVHYATPNQGALLFDDFSIELIQPIDTVDLKLSVVSDSSSSPLHSMILPFGEDLKFNMIVQNLLSASSYSDSLLFVRVEMNDALLAMYELPIDSIPSGESLFHTTPVLLSAESIVENSLSGNNIFTVSVYPSVEYADANWTDNSDTIVVNIINLTPVIQIDSSALSFISGLNSPSTSQLIAISTRNINSSLIAQCSSPFQISINHNSWDTIVTTSPSGGAIFVRYAPTACQNVAGTLTIGNSQLSTSIMLLGNSPTYIISAFNAEYGAIMPNGDVEVCYNDNQLFMINPIPGYAVDSVWIDDIYVGAIDSYYFTNVMEYHSIRASFYRILTPFVFTNIDTLFFEAQLLYESVPQAINVFGFDLSTEITAISSSPFYISTDGINWSNNVVLPSIGGAVFVRYAPTFAGQVSSVLEFRNSLAQSKVVRLYGNTSYYTIQTFCSLGGTIYPNGDTVVPHGSFLEVSVFPDSLHYLVNLIVDGEFLPPTNYYSFIGIDNNHFIYALFAEGTNIKEYKSALTLYPNPTNGYFRVMATNTQSALASLMIYDIYGSLVYQNANYNMGDMIDISYLANGIYAVKVIIDDTILMGKVMKQ